MGVGLRRRPKRLPTRNYSPERPIRKLILGAPYASLRDSIALKIT